MRFAAVLFLFNPLAIGLAAGLAVMLAPTCDEDHTYEQIWDTSGKYLSWSDRFPNTKEC